MNSVLNQRNGDFSQTYLLGSFVRNAQRSAKIHLQLRKKRLDSLWRPQLVSLLLPRFCNTPFFATDGWLARLQPSRVSPGRSFSVSCLFDCGRVGAHRKHSISGAQRTHSAVAGVERLSSSRHLANLLVAFWTQLVAQPANRPRQAPDGVVPPLESSLQRYCGCRYHGVDDLWSTRRCGPRLYSQATPSAIFVCPDSIQRRAQRSEPGGRTASGEHSGLGRSRGIPPKCARQAAGIDCSIAHPLATGWSILRSQDHRTFGKSRVQLRDGSPHDQPSEEKNAGRPLPRICQRLGSSRIFLHSLGLATRATFRSRAATGSGRTRGGPTPSVHLQALYLSPRAADQPGTEPGRSLAFLLQPSLSRTPVARVQGSLRHEQDPESQFLGQRRLSGSDHVGLRLGFGFSKTLFASRSTALEHLYLASRALVAASRVGATWQSQPPRLARQVSSARPIHAHPAGCPASAASGLTNFAKPPTFAAREKCGHQSLLNQN